MKSLTCKVSVVGMMKLAVERVCADDELRCNSGQCINKLSYCTGNSICRDGTKLIAACPELIEGKKAFHQRQVQKKAVRSHFQIIKRQPELLECETDQFLCVNRHACVPDRWICDGFDNCGDGSDEPENCVTRECPEGYLKCSNGQCLNKSDYCLMNLRCNGYASLVSDADCPRAECQSDHFTCRGVTKCIQLAYVCNNYDDCGDRSDELNCETIECPENPVGYVRCRNGLCLQQDSYCSGNVRCGSDTFVSDANCALAECRSNQFTCTGVTRCVDWSRVCDLNNDCGDMSDEQNCEERVCANDELRCNSGQCINKLSHCTMNSSPTFCRDGVTLTGACLDFSCPNDYLQYFQCSSDGKCIWEEYRCNGRDDCPDGSDEAECLDFTCPPDHFQCQSNGVCILDSHRCDGDERCIDGSDEAGCLDFTCSLHHFQCQSNGVCIWKWLRCDGHENCVDGSDEAGCLDFTCSPHHFKCQSNGKCIWNRHHCDGHEDCIGGSDETGCGQMQLLE